MTKNSTSHKPSSHCVWPNASSPCTAFATILDSKMGPFLSFKQENGLLYTATRSKARDT